MSVYFKASSCKSQAS